MSLSSVMSDSWWGCSPTRRNVACQAPLSLEFSSQEYCSELPLSSPQYLPDPGIEREPPAVQADLLSVPPGKPQN